MQPARGPANAETGSAATAGGWLRCPGRTAQNGTSRAVPRSATVVYVCWTPTGGPPRVVFATVVMPTVRNACRLDSGSLMPGSRIENVVVLASGTVAMTTLTSVPMFTLDEVIWLPAKVSVFVPFLK